ncbi:hypothetical protein O6H91_05G069800 [Diphasiastrum complanatum]|uniref:Uncharacterized protein n=1 Tax=Diphasiastrum complanatum TaxID=34168 RepID=A0ACC2DP89_DIPCM|nr:hypothetical protein O6H91_05G069800 [Diphasiastrum complanatum]
MRPTKLAIICNAGVSGNGEGLDRGAGSEDDALSDDLIQQILSWLPLKSLARACAVCKSWNQIVRSQSFVHRLLRVNPPQPWLLFASTVRKAVAYDFSDAKWRQLEMPSFSQASLPGDYAENLIRVRPLCSAQGLVCFRLRTIPRTSNAYFRIAVCNALTRRSRVLPSIKLYDSHVGNPVVGFNCKSSDSFDVVVVCYSKHSDVSWNYKAQVFSSASGAWEQSSIELINGVPAFVGMQKVFHKGKFCIVVNSSLAYDTKPSGILCYDVKLSTWQMLTLSTLTVGARVDTGYAFLYVDGLVSCMGRLLLIGTVGNNRSMSTIWEFREQSNEWIVIGKIPQALRKNYRKHLPVENAFGALNGMVYLVMSQRGSILTFDVGTGFWNWSDITWKSQTYLESMFVEPRLDIWV